MRAIATVADSAVAPGVRRLARSLAAHGAPKMTVFQPEAFAVPHANIRPITAARFYGDAYDGRRNALAAFKSYIITAYREGDVLAILDGSDVLCVGALEGLFDEFESSGCFVAARPFKQDVPTQHPEDSIVRAAFGTTGPHGPYCNSGVVLFRVGAAARMFCAAWRALLCASLGRFSGNNPIIGDQQDFNVLFRMAHEQGDGLCLDRAYNVRGKEARTCRVEHGRVYTDEGSATLLHFSGTGKRTASAEDSAFRRWVGPEVFDFAMAGVDSEGGSE